MTIRAKAIARRHLTALRSLHPVFRSKVKSVLEELKENGWQPVVWQGKRTSEEQAEKVRKGFSRTLYSWHVQTTSNMMSTGLDRVDIVYGAAADIVDQRWRWEGPCRDHNHPFWKDLGRIARKHGLEWGGDWVSFKDVAHLQMKFVEMPSTNKEIV